MTGQDFSRYWQQLVDKAYSGYYDNTKQARLFKEVLIDIIQNKQNDANVQQYYDELNSLTKTEYAATLSANSDLLVSAVPDYFHFKAFKMLTKEFIGTVVGVSGNTVTFTTGMNIQSGEEVLFEGVTPLSSTLNGSFYCKPMSKTTVKLYTNQALTIAATITPQFSSGGSAYRQSWNYGRVILSDEKISVFAVSDARNPKIEFADNKLKFTPSTPNGQVVIDYYTLPPVFIDPSNNVIDLEDTYTLKFLMYLAQRAAVRFKEIIGDGQGTQLSAMAVVENP